MRLNVMRPSGSSCSLSRATRLSLTAISLALCGRAPKLRDDRRGNAGGRLCNGDDDRPLFRLGLLQRLELARQQRRWHEMVRPPGQPRRDQSDLTLEVDETDMAVGPDDALPIGALERRARHDGRRAVADPVVDPLGDGIKPRPAI